MRPLLVGEPDDDGVLMGVEAVGVADHRLPVGKLCRWHWSEGYFALGAENVADRDAVSIEHAASEVNVADDPVGADGVWRSVLQTVRDGGVQVESNYYPSHADRAEPSGRGVRLEFVEASARRAVLDELAERFDAGVLTPRVAGTFPLAQAARAHIEAGRADHPRGHYVLQPAAEP